MPRARHILSFAEYAAIQHDTPYIIDVAHGSARLLLFGGLRDRGRDSRGDVGTGAPGSREVDGNVVNRLEAVGVALRVV